MADLVMSAILYKGPLSHQLKTKLQLSVIQLIAVILMKQEYTWIVGKRVMLLNQIILSLELCPCFPSSILKKY